MLVVGPCPGIVGQDDSCDYLLCVKKILKLLCVFVGESRAVPHAKCESCTAVNPNLAIASACIKSGTWDPSGFRLLLAKQCGG